MRRELSGVFSVAADHPYVVDAHLAPGETCAVATGISMATGNDQMRLVAQTDKTTWDLVATLSDP